MLMACSNKHLWDGDKPDRRLQFHRSGSAPDSGPCWRYGTIPPSKPPRSTACQTTPVTPVDVRQWGRKADDKKKRDGRSRTGPGG